MTHFCKKNLIEFIHNSRFTNTPTSRLITHYLILFLIMLIIPVFGYGDWRHIVMPAITLGTALTAYTTRILRSAIIETLQSEYLIALRARGISKRFVLGKHILKNALIPVVTVVGLEFGMILEGAVITETVFAWPGVRRLVGGY
ncbi:MAG: ABC transporter permease [Desulfobacterales bacterium]|jgi:peptide/nickel transport system permease protein|nr:ABC transporter permease [Desulfobacterales bacterium]MDL2122851.1 ABC transporter permease [Deltaproteobacteria bacterium]